MLEIEEYIDTFSDNDNDFILPDESSLSLNRYWKYQHFKYRDYVEYIRKCPLNEKDNKTARWLNFRIKKVLNLGKEYVINISLKYEEDIFFTPFLHGEGKIDHLPTKRIEAGKWMEFSYKYIPSYSNIRWLCLSATNFISAGRKLCIKKISIVEKEGD